MMRGPSRDNGDTHNSRERQPQLLIHKCHHCPLRTRIEMKKSLISYKGTGSLSHFHPARARDNGDSLSRRLLQENGCAGWCSRLKIQAGCRLAPHALPDPNDADVLWSATAGRLVSNEVGIFCIQRNVPNRVAKSDATDHRTPE